jgi:hypothetical protein
VRIRVYCSVCVGRMMIGGHCLFFVSDVPLVSLSQMSSRLSDVCHVTGITGEFVNAAFFVLWGCVIRMRHSASIKCCESEVCVKLVVLLRNYIRKPLLVDKGSQQY